MSKVSNALGKKFTITNWAQSKRKGKPITMMTAYDYPSAKFVDEAGINAILVGDSVNMVVLGHESTVSLTLEEQLHHCRAVARGATRPFLVGDMPFMSYEINPIEAVRNAGRFLKEGKMDAVKLEGGEEVAETVRRIVKAGVPVMGHIGLTPQKISQLGGYRVQGRTASAATELLESARALEEAGCFSIVLESMPSIVATQISQRISIPTIGIGAGSGCDGQVLVFHDALGMYDDLNPRFVKRFANLKNDIVSALSAYRDEVEARSFPAVEHTYTMKPEEEESFQKLIDNEKLEENDENSP